MAQQTSVDWLIEKFKIYLPSIHHQGLENVFTQAKEIREKELANAYNEGWEDAMKEAIKEIYKHQ